MLDGASYEIAGVMPPGFRLLTAPSEVWIPLRPLLDPIRGSSRIMFVIANYGSGSHSGASAAGAYRYQPRDCA